MNRAIIAIVVVVVVAVGIVYFLNPFASHQPAPIITGHTGSTNTSSNSTVTKNVTQTNATNSTGTGNYTYKSCLSSFSTAAIYNGNFSLGTYAGWNATGDAWSDAPTNIVYANANEGYYSSPWSGYNGTYFASSYHGGTSIGVGNLTSNPFLVIEPYLNFKIVSPQDNLLYVEITYENSTGGNQTYAVAHYNTFAVTNNTSPQSTFENASVLVLPLLCKYARIKVVDGSLTTKANVYDYIAAGDFMMSKTQVQAPGAGVSNVSYAG